MSESPTSDRETPPPAGGARRQAPPLTATYRVQLNAEFGFDAAREAVPYLARLGVSHLYCSPILAARPGSQHGYDVIDPSHANPELGGEEALRALADELHAHGMGLLLDIVPNHMGAGPANPYWTDVLTWGRESRYAPWFDLDWGAEGAARGGRIVLAVLGDEPDAVVGRGELAVAFRDGRFLVTYFENEFPVDPRTAHRLFAFHHRYEFPDGADAQAVLRVRDALFPERGATLSREAAERGVAELAGLVERSPAFREYIEATLAAFSEGDEGRYRLRALLDLQAWSLAFWRSGLRDVNYRRFFDVNDLLGVRVENPEVFDATHECLLAWVADGIVDGVRVDHIDGLRDPLAYLHRLRRALDARRPGEHVPIFVEKILSPGERLRDEWPIDGTTGYEFVTALEPALIDPAGWGKVEAAYRQLLRLGERAEDFHALARRGKELVLRRALQPDVRRLVRLLDPLSRGAGLRATKPELGEAVVQLLVAMPVYRTYVRAESVEVDGQVTTRWTVADEDRAIVDRALERALSGSAANPDVVRFVARALVGEALPTEADAAPRAPRRATTADPAASAREFAPRFQQTSGPATAKGIEDTALYRWFPIASLCEVGGEPVRPPDDALDRLHAANRERQERWPHSLLTVTTHDTKRTADVRARLDTLGDLSDEWPQLVARWRARHARLRTRVGGRPAPDANAEYLLYQTIVGIWPLPGGDLDDAAHASHASARGELADRVVTYMQKARREAKAQTSWTDPNEGYEQAVERFARALIQEEPGAEFRRELDALMGRVGRAGMWNGLSRLLVHLTSPGTPDIYQGDELWLHALVDPDNRRAVDYAARTAALERIHGKTGADDSQARCAELLAAAHDGRVKLYAGHRVLAARRADPELFTRGTYLPLTATGRGAAHVVAFARVLDGRAAVTVATRLPLGLRADGAPPVGADVWGDTTIRLPDGLDGGLVDTFAGHRTGGGGTLIVAEALQHLPVALLMR